MRVKLLKQLKKFFAVSGITILLLIKYLLVNQEEKYSIIIFNYFLRTSYPLNKDVING